MNIERECKIKNLNWNALSEIRSRLEKLAISFKSFESELYWYPNSYTIQSSVKTLELILENGEPKCYSVNIFAEKADERISFRISRLRNIYGQEILKVIISNVDDDSELNSLMDYLNLEEAEKAVSVKDIKRTAFIAYRFDDIGENLTLKLSRFLELLSISVVTGRAYSPKKVSEKVEERINSQSLLFVLLTEGNDDTWLKQEPILAKAHNKPIFILKESKYEFNSGIFADQEFIPFDIDNFEKTFTQILEGLRELNLI